MPRKILLNLMSTDIAMDNARMVLKNMKNYTDYMDEIGRYMLRSDAPYSIIYRTNNKLVGFFIEQVHDAWYKNIRG
jgi:hypothetical protein